MIKSKKMFLLSTFIQQRYNLMTIEKYIIVDKK